ncbi:MAG: FliM/FliN family flagellar motor switch protein [Leptospiraceae bacterium]|nr:FliM/FliN family flagellar motor switch protein [Leptospiraceae bacterium]
MSEESLSKKEIEALLEATTKKEDKPIYDKIQSDPFLAINNDFWMREASIEILENIKMENFKSLSKKTNDKLSASERNLFKEIITAILSEVIKSKKFSEIELGKKIGFEIISPKKIRKQFKPGMQCYYGNFSGRIQGIYSILLTNEVTVRLVKAMDKMENSTKLNHLKNINDWLFSVISSFTDILTLKIGEVKSSEMYQVMVTKSDQLILPEGSNYFKIELEISIANETFSFFFLFSVYNAKNILNHILQLNPNVKRNLKNHHRIIKSIESKLNRFMANRETYLSENELDEISSFISKSLSKEEKGFLLTPVKEKIEKSDLEISLVRIIISLANEIIDRRYKLNEAEKERKEKLNSLISSIPFPVNIRFEDEIFDYKNFKNRTQNTSNIERFIGKRGSLIFSNKSLQEIILRKENEKLLLFDLTDNVIPSKYELHLTTSEIMNLELEAEIEIGRSKLPLDQLINIKPGNVIELNKDMTEPVFLVIENVIFAKTTVVVSNEKFGIWIEDIGSPNDSRNIKMDILNKEEIKSQTKIPMADLRVILGKLKLTIKDLLTMSKGSIVELEKSIFEPIQIIVGDDLIFPGEVIALENGKFGVRFVNNVSYSQKSETNVIDLDDEIGNDKVDLLTNSNSSVTTSPFEFLEKIEANTIAGIIQIENAQMIAMILSFLSAEKSAAILTYLNENLQTDVVAKIAIGQKANSEIAKEVAKILEKKVSILVQNTFANVPGFDSINKILNSTDSENRRKMISGLEKNFPDIYNILKSNQD